MKRFYSLVLTLEQDRVFDHYVFDMCRGEECMQFDMKCPDVRLKVQVYALWNSRDTQPLNRTRSGNAYQPRLTFLHISPVLDVKLVFFLKLTAITRVLRTSNTYYV